MLSGILTFWRLVTSKAGLILSALFIFGLMAVRIATTLIQTGEQNERLKTFEQTVRSQNEEAKINATVDSLSAGTVRDRMLAKWSKQ